MKLRIKSVPSKIKILFGIVIIILIGSFLGMRYLASSQTFSYLKNELQNTQNELATAQSDLSVVSVELENLKNEDQVKKNEELQREISNIQDVYKKSVSAYESLLDLKSKTTTTKFDQQYALVVSQLSNRKLTEASETLSTLEKAITEEESKLTLLQPTIAASVPVQNTPPGSGYSRQQVQTDVGNFLVSIVSADIASTRVIVDTASTSDCSDNCPVLPLASYVSRSGAYAGVNGSYFCPASYPSCVGKTNTFDLLVMNKDKYYFNSANNVYSNNPAVIFGNGYIRFVSAVSQWGRDTGVDGVLSNYPLLIQGSSITFGGDDDPKKGSKGNRSFVANKGNTFYIGVVHSATVAESARVMKAMDMENALNLDNGGSTALWSGGYKVGPGRDLPNVILFVKK